MPAKLLGGELCGVPGWFRLRGMFQQLRAAEFSVRAEVQHNELPGMLEYPTKRLPELRGGQCPKPRLCEYHNIAWLLPFHRRLLLRDLQHCQQLHQLLCRLSLWGVQWGFAAAKWSVPELPS